MDIKVDLNINMSVPEYLLATIKSQIQINIQSISNNNNNHSISRSTEINRQSNGLNDQNVLQKDLPAFCEIAYLEQL